MPHVSYLPPAAPTPFGLNHSEQPLSPDVRLAYDGRRLFLNDCSVA